MLPLFLYFFIIYLLVVVAFSSLAKIWGECSTIHSPPALYFIYLFIYLFHFGRMFDHLFPVCALFYLFIYFILGECLTIIYFEVEIRSRPLILLFMPGSVHSGSASCDDCCRMFPDKLRVSSFPDRFCLLYTSPSPRDMTISRMPSSA